MSLKNKLQKTVILHPVLFAIFPIAFIFSINLHTLVLEDIFIPLSLVVAATILLWTLLRYFFKSTENYAHNIITPTCVQPSLQIS